MIPGGNTMVIGEQLKFLPEQKKLSQCDIQQRTGLLRCYISRIENGHTVPSIETLEKLARALEIPMYQFFYDGEHPPALKLPKNDTDGWGSSKAEARVLDRLQRLLSRTSEADRKLLLFVARQMSRRKRRAGRR
jgi:transcriptional regulator with XRE-family HTH domain